ncbi:membrane cofactor protein isoform X2 [Pipistrellus kuhlii]|uniref:membrane cofactor protein isoform X2 n=1 Tax=Pipistrellus kuhlii TaxID=59472 RepID=UPI00174F7AFA|nr:membrane cofactor protein isoform X2 [Pipistrellus kuhlii]
MTRSCEPRRAPARPPESPLSSWRFVGIAVVTLVLQFPASLGDCGKPPVFQSMKLKGTLKPSYAPGEKIYFECNPAYYYSYFYGLSTYCEKNNTWHPIDEACYRKQCPVPKVPNGEVYEQFEPNTGFQFGKNAYFYCNYGYYLKGEAVITCELSGDTVYWGSDIPTCEKILCKAPADIVNGKRTNNWRTEFEFNEVVSFTCDPSNGSQEFSLVGEKKLTCSGPEEWSSDPPQCKVVLCEPPVLKYGKPLSEMKEKFFYKDEVAFQCLKGFYLNGSNPVFCGGNSTWEPEMPTCIKGFKPTHPTKPPVSKYPGYPKPLESPPIHELFEIDPGVIALIILTIRKYLKLEYHLKYYCELHSFLMTL